MMDAGRHDGDDGKYLCVVIENVPRRRNME